MNVNNMIKYINMKKSAIFISFCLWILMSCQISSSSNNVNLNLGLVAYYPFNGDAKDARTNHLNVWEQHYY
jgi:hypothetical protein